VADSVGRIYVDVIADTSRMKEQIQKAGVRAGRGGAKAFTKSFQEQTDKDLKKMNFDRLAKKFTDDMTRDIARKIKENVERGIHTVDASEFYEKWAVEMARIAKLTGHTQADMAKAWKEFYIPAMRSAYDALEKEEKGHAAMREKHAQELLDIEKATAKKLADYERSLRDKATQDEIRNLDRLIRITEQNIERERKARKKLNAEVEDDNRSTLGRWFGGFEDVVNRGSMSLRRMGTGGFFDSLTNVAGSLLGILGKISKIGKIFVKPIEWLGQGLEGLGTIVGKLGGKFAKVGGAISRMGGALLKLAKNPYVLAAAAVAALTSGLALIGKALSFVLILIKTAGTLILQLGTWLAYAGASAAVLAPMLISVGIGAGVAFLGMKDAASAAKNYFQILQEDDPEKRAEAMKAYNEELKKLGPNTRAAVKALEPLMDTFKGIKTEMSERIFKDVADDLKGLAPLMDIIKNGMGGVADSIGIVVGKFIELFQSSQFLKDVTILFDAARNIVRDLGSAAADTFGGLTTVFAIIAPLAERLAEGLMFAAQNFKDFTETEEGQNKIKSFFENAYQNASLLWGAIKDVFAGIASLIFAVNEDTGQQSFIERIAEAAENFRKWAADPKTKEDVAGWIDKAKTAFGLLKDVVVKVIEKWNELDTPKNRETFTKVVDTVGDLIGLFFDIIRIAGFVASVLYAPFKPVVQVFKDIVGWVSDLVGWLGKLKVPDLKWPKMPDWLPGDQGGGKNKKAAGGLVFAPTRAIIGEAGPEAIIPLTRPLSQVDPSVRAMAALLRGQQKPKVGMAATATIGPSMTNNFNITSQAEDPRAVAAQVVNRLAASAR
jgi:histone H3/H4